MPAMCALFVLVPALVAQAALALPSPQEVQDFRAALKEKFPVSDDSPGTSAGGSPKMRTLVRLGFHDCTSERCDGCIDPADPDNPGLGAMVDALSPICQNFSSAMTTADCWATAATMAAEQAAYLGSVQLKMPLFFGRTDTTPCQDFTPDNPEGLFPHGMDGFAKTFTYFEDVFNFTQRETVAIMGAHALGMGSINGSGFDGSWTVSPSTLDNSFYSDMNSSFMAWSAEQLPTDKWQWRSAQGQQMMLNSDMCLLKKVLEDDPAGSHSEPGGPSGGEPICEYESCEWSETAAITFEFAASNQVFIDEFGVVFAKMLIKGYDECQLDVMVSADFEDANAPFDHGVNTVLQRCGKPLTVPGAAPGTLVLGGDGTAAGTASGSPSPPTPIAGVVHGSGGAGDDDGEHSEPVPPDEAGALQDLSPDRAAPAGVDNASGSMSATCAQLLVAFGTFWLLMV